MNRKYCDCGGVTEYSLSIPARCSSCGEPFSKSFSAAQPSKPKMKLPRKKVVQAEEDYEDEEELEEDYELEEDEEEEVQYRSPRRKINAEKMAADVDIPDTTYRGTNILNVMPPTSDGFKRSKPGKVNKKQALADYKQRATPKKDSIQIK